jgi:hypothetical protein
MQIVGQNVRLTRTGCRFEIIASFPKSLQPERFVENLDVHVVLFLHLRRRQQCLHFRNRTVFSKLGLADISPQLDEAVCPVEASPQVVLSGHAGINFALVLK